MITDDDLKEQGAKIIAARRRVWDLERRLASRPGDNFVKHDLTLARRAYTECLKERKQLVSKVQARFI